MILVLLTQQALLVGLPVGVLRTGWGGGSLGEEAVHFAGALDTRTYVTTHHRLYVLHHPNAKYRSALWVMFLKCLVNGACGNWRQAVLLVCV